MARSRKATGTCHLCGVDGRLSFEHVPPRAAFNDKPVLLYKLDQIADLGPGDRPAGGGRIQQKGAGAYTLCPRCNNNTGSWYGRHFVDWCHQAMLVLHRAEGNPSLFYLNYLFPLSVIKQVATMFFSVNGPRFGRANPELVQFVLDRNRKYLPSQYRFFTYFTGGGRLRSTGIAGKLDTTTGDVQLLSEVAFPPLGYVMTLKGEPPDGRLFEITHFARFDYQEFAVMELRLPVMPTHLWFPGDYRTKAEILDQVEKNRRDYPDV
jgi:hypothetical protein